MDNIEKFINREIRAKDIFTIKKIEKNVSYDFIKQHHYLGDAKFFAKFSYGLYNKETDELIGVTSYTNPQGAVALKGWWGLPNQDQTIMELCRLCVIPKLNGTNATSYLLGNSIRMLKKEGIRAVTTLADNSRHAGSIYQVCNFTYYGLSNKKSDFFIYDGSGKTKRNHRGSTKDERGVWLPRTQKHRYAFILDKTLKCKYEEKPLPGKEEFEEYGCSCGGTHEIYDKRFKETFTCPICVDEFKPIEKTEEKTMDEKWDELKDAGLDEPLTPENTPEYFPKEEVVMGKNSSIVPYLLKQAEVKEEDSEEGEKEWF
jgi:hypothetical protein